MNKKQTEALKVLPTKTESMEKPEVSIEINDTTVKEIENLPEMPLPAIVKVDEYKEHPL